MKTLLIRIQVLALGTVLLAGCASSPPVDPNNINTKMNPAMTAHQKAVRIARAQQQGTN